MVRVARFAALAALLAASAPALAERAGLPALPRYEPEERTPMRFIRDLLDDKLPLRIDFGAEPNEHGSRIFGGAQYDWSAAVSSGLEASYDSYSMWWEEISGPASGLERQSARSITFTPYPLILYFGDPSPDARTALLRLSFGGLYGYNTQEATSGYIFSGTDEGGNAQEGYVTSRTGLAYHVAGPAFSYALRVPFLRYLGLCYEGMLVPGFFIYMDADIALTLHSTSGAIDYGASGTSSRWSAPFITQALSLDVYKYLRLKTQMQFQRLNLRMMEADVGQGSTRAVDYVFYGATLRYGLELVKPGATRKKDAHLSAGVYYEQSWTWLDAGGSREGARAGRWVICFGT